MKCHNIITLKQLENLNIKNENTAWDISLSTKEKIKNINLTLNQKMDDLNIIKPKFKFSLTKKILIFVISLIIISAGIVILKYLFYDRQNKSNYQLNMDSGINFRHNQTKKTNYSADSDPVLKKQKVIDLVTDENSIFQRIYYFIDTAQCSRNVNREKVYISLKELADSVEKAREMGITDIVFPQSSFDISEENSISQLKELVKEARLNKITLNLFLDMQFSTPERVRHLLPEYFYKKNSSGNYLVYKERYIHDQTNLMSEKYISNYINKLTSIGISNFIIGELPRDIMSDDNGEFHILPFINKIKFKERFNTIRNSTLNINLLFSYYNKIEHEEIKSMDLNCDGAVFHIHNSDNQNLKRDENFISQMFQEDENKLLMFDFKLFKLKEFNMRFLLGQYLFSPVPIILNIKDEHYCPYSINIFYEELLASEEYELKEKFIEIVKVKRTDTYFDKKSVSQGKTFGYESIIISIRGKDSNSLMNETLIYIYNYNFEDKFIHLDNIFSVKYPFKYQVIYDNEDLSKNGTILKRSGFRLTGQKLLIIKVTK